MENEFKEINKLSGKKMNLSLYLEEKNWKKFKEFCKVRGFSVSKVMDIVIDGFIHKFEKKYGEIKIKDGK